MSNPDPLSLILSLLDLVKLGNSLSHVDDHVKHFYEQLDETRENLDWVRGELALFGPQLDPVYKKRIENKCDKAESDLEKAEIFAQNHLQSERPVRNLKWVLGKHEIAQIHLDSLSNHTNELRSAIPSPLWCGISPYTCLFPMQQIGNNTAGIGPPADHRNSSPMMHIDPASSRRQIFPEFAMFCGTSLAEQERRRDKEIQEVFEFVLGKEPYNKPYSCGEDW